MGDLIKEYYAIAITLVVFSVVVGVIVYVGNIGNDLMDVYEKKNDVKETLKLSREIYGYMDKVITGNDVLIAVKKFTRLYDMKIEVGFKGSGVWILLDSEGDPEEWKLDIVSERMGRSINENYLSKLIFDENGDIVGIEFTLV